VQKGVFQRAPARAHALAVVVRIESSSRRSEVSLAYINSAAPDRPLLKFDYRVWPNGVDGRNFAPGITTRTFLNELKLYCPCARFFHAPTLAERRLGVNKNLKLFVDRPL